MNPLLIEPTPEQLALLGVLWEAAREQGEWATWDGIERVLYRGHDIANARDVLQSLPMVHTRGSLSGYGFVQTTTGIAALPGPAERPTITLAGLNALSQDDFVDLVVHLVSVLAERERAVEPDANGVASGSYTSADLQEYLRKSGGRWPSPTTLLIGRILDGELATTGGLTVRGDTWELRLDRRLRPFRGVQRIEDYLDRIVSMLQPVEGAIDSAPAAPAIEVLDDNPIWKPGNVRVFVSHLSTRRAFAAEVANELARHGVHGFVAHDTIEISAEWQAVMADALRSAQALVGLSHPGFGASFWCQQEIGWAYGRGLPSYFVPLGEIPPGFPASRQWHAPADSSSADVAAAVINWLNTLPEFSATLGDAAISAVRSAGSYEDARDAALRVESFGALTNAQWSALGSAFWENDQVHGSVWANPIVKRIFASHQRPFPERPT